MRRTKLVKRLYWLCIVGFILLNVVSFFHAYKFTHYADSTQPKTKSPQELSFFEKLQPLFLGINNPRPQNKSFPSQKHETVILESNKRIECWLIQAPSPKGTVLLFHGYTGKKSALLGRAEEFLGFGYSVLLVDLMGSGGSEGSKTTIGYDEAEQVKTAVEFIKNKGEKNIVLFGTSMGAVAVMKAMQDYALDVQQLILECPFGSMYRTTCARFRNMGVPPFPFASFLVFWGGIQNGFWAFGHHPITYAKAIQTPTLLIYGEKDKEVSREEIDEIFANLQGDKVLKTYTDAGHGNYFTLYKQAWKNDVLTFLGKH
jgi:uncharacterized protein